MKTLRSHLFAADKGGATSGRAEEPDKRTKAEALKARDEAVVLPPQSGNELGNADMRVVPPAEGSDDESLTEATKKIKEERLAKAKEDRQSKSKKS